MFIGYDFRISGFRVVCCVWGNRILRFCFTVFCLYWFPSHFGCWDRASQCNLL